MWWPTEPDELVALQDEIAAAARAELAERPFSIDDDGPPLLGGCFIAFAKGEAGPGHPGDRAWAAAVAWRPTGQSRHPDDMLRGHRAADEQRRAADVSGQGVVAGLVPASYAPGLLALREGPLLAAAVGTLRPRPDVTLVDATGLDHPRRAGLAVHVGAATGGPTVGVTRRPLVARGERPPLRRGERAPLQIGGETVGYWVCTNDGINPVIAHAGWRTDPTTAADIVLLASTDRARTPVPLQEARRVAREARYGRMKT